MNSLRPAGNTWCEHRQRHHQAVPGQPRSFRGVVRQTRVNHLQIRGQKGGDFAADDVTSETFLVAWEQLETYDLDREDARPWLFGIATNLLRRHHRAEARLLKVAAKAASRDAVGDESDRIAAQVDATMTTGRIAWALKAMAAIDRETLLLYAWADLTYEGIALAMDVPVGTVRSRLNRARRTLRTQLDLEILDETENDHGRLAAAPRNA
ncbi:RNA polymerase sigma factor [Arthrobacter sp. OVS8]|nr:RNA polymerase sigma factor [Arthrobacter sp. OVS8]